MSTPFTGVDHFARTIMGRVNADGGDVLAVEVVTGAVDWHAAPQRAVWEPTTDRFTGAQKTRGSRAKSSGTRMAGGVVHLWAAGSADGTITDTAATEALVLRVARQISRYASPFVTLGEGAWNPNPGATPLGRTYDLAFAVAVDLAFPAGPVAHPTSVSIVIPSGSSGDGDVDAGEP